MGGSPNIGVHVREIGRVAMGFFPTPPRIVRSISKLFERPAGGLVTLLDPGCGEGVALQQLHQAWQREDGPQFRPYGIELDRTRALRADACFKALDGEALWSAIEDAACDADASLLFFNPPYDRIRGSSRMELLLFNAVREWVARGGHLVLIVPDYVLADRYCGLAVSVERNFQLLGLWRFPEPEYGVFKQCVLVAKRRDRALAQNHVPYPEWAENPQSWPELPDDPAPVATLRPVTHDMELRREKIAADLIVETLSKSPLRNALLGEAMAPPPKPERPLMPLKRGHLALALAGGHCDGIIEADGTRFLLKGTLVSRIRKVAQEAKTNSEGEKIADIDVMRTVYEMKVRCLREFGEIESYGSHDEEEEAIEAIEQGKEEAA